MQPSKWWARSEAAVVHRHDAGTPSLVWTDLQIRQKSLSWKGTPGIDDQPYRVS